MRYIVAVSGGVDSVVLLDMMSKRHASQDIIVAHFDHGIRGEDSSADARFVKALTQKYGVYFVFGEGNLSKSASEAEAREKRYEFLRGVASQFKGQIVTAHHEDDLIETIAINISRGTGWRGLAVFTDQEIRRPLIGRSKSELYEYALAHGLEWVEDATNQSDAYLRNRIRKKLHLLSTAERERLLDIRKQQLLLRHYIDIEVRKVGVAHDRYFYTMIEERVAVELLKRLTHGKLLTKQLQMLWLKVKLAKPGSTYQAGSDVEVEFSSEYFSVKHSGELL